MKKYFIIALLATFVGGQLKAQTQTTLSPQKEKMEKERFAQLRADERKKAEVLRNEKSLESMI